jgi:hypothetical protein
VGGYRVLGKKKIVSIQFEAQHPSPSGEGVFFWQYAFFSDLVDLPNIIAIIAPAA